MPIETVCVPVCDPRFEVRVFALHKGRDAGPFAYLQAARQGTHRVLGKELEQTAAASQYNRNLSRYKANLTAAIEGPLDALLSPPSDHPWQAEPYRKALANRFRNAVDLTGSFSRSGLARAGTGAKLEDVVASLAYKSTAREKNFQCIAIVDDTFTRGVTVAATVIHLRQHGLSEECHVVVACPLWLDTVKPAASLA
jgi:predicted phosphoribosyltransferase